MCVCFFYVIVVGRIFLKQKKERSSTKRKMEASLFSSTNQKLSNESIKKLKKSRIVLRMKLDGPQIYVFLVPSLYVSFKQKIT